MLYVGLETLTENTTKGVKYRVKATQIGLFRLHHSTDKFLILIEHKINFM